MAIGILLELKKTDILSHFKLRTLSLCYLIMLVRAFSSHLCGNRDHVITLAAAKTEWGRDLHPWAGLILPVPRCNYLVNKIYSRRSLNKKRR